MTNKIISTTWVYNRHLLVCIGEQCIKNSMGQALYDLLRDKLKAVELNEGALRVKRSRATCFGTC